MTCLRGIFIKFMSIKLKDSCFTWDNAVWRFSLSNQGDDAELSWITLPVLQLTKHYKTSQVLRHTSRRQNTSRLLARFLGLRKSPSYRKLLWFWSTLEKFKQEQYISRMHKIVKMKTSFLHLYLQVLSSPDAENSRRASGGENELCRSNESREWEIIKKAIKRIGHNS